jgi:hypothetical protein
VGPALVSVSDDSDGTSVQRRQQRWVPRRKDLGDASGIARIFSHLCEGSGTQWTLCSSVSMAVCRCWWRTLPIDASARRRFSTATGKSDDPHGSPRRMDLCRTLAKRCGCVSQASPERDP